MLARRTRLLVGAHGAGLAHALWMEEGSAIVEFLPVEPDDGNRTRLCFFALASALGHRYEFVPIPTPHVDAPLRVPVRELGEALKRVAREME